MKKNSFMVNCSREEWAEDEVCPWVEECRPGVKRVLKVVKMFGEGEYNERQVVGWVQNHCQSYKPIMVGPFFHRK